MKNLRLAYPLLTAVVAAALAVLCFQVIPEWDPYLGLGGFSNFARSAGAAVVLGALYVFSGSWLLDHRQMPKTKEVRFSAWDAPEEFVDRYSRETKTPTFLNVSMLIVVVLVAALAIGIGKVLVQKSSITPPLPAHLVFVFVMLCTAVFEEVLFRGFLFEGFAKTLRERNPSRALLYAAVVSSVLFGILHITSDLGSLFRATAYIEAVVKVLEGTFFGLATCALYAKTRSVWPSVLVHFAFDLISEGPIFLATGTITSSYITGSPADIMVLLVGIVILAAPARWAMNYLSH